MNQSQAMTRDDVLYAFAVEDAGNNDTLMRYLAMYPQYAHDLVDLSRELARPVSHESLSAADAQRVDAAVARFRAGAGHRVPASFAAQAFNVAAERLQLPRLVLVSFRERRVDLASVPARFLERLAGALESTLDQLRTFLSQPPMVSAARQSKSRIKPVAATKVSFEKVLRDAGVEADRVQALIERGE
ncbi:hypothetical protein UA18_01838 [Burkholderia multivorans]|uniref:Uncharacterized protein n=1 Tax=Burkholderia multivorans TaxID=87883 RepID=A0ABD7LI54_9BURK|nr:hypothetical protein [Burkholderia multivorans]SAK17676.1 hypothetical protein UA18_01838 [Burkholderia multivorans]SAK20469.1 hypothetical protein UA17_02036 [Burkholderia multivorans]HEF5152607.1 hypothetical protein [Burkholderia multivorans]